MLVFPAHWMNLSDSCLLICLALKGIDYVKYRCFRDVPSSTPNKYCYNWVLFKWPLNNGAVLLQHLSLWRVISLAVSGCSQSTRNYLPFEMSLRKFLHFRILRFHSQFTRCKMYFINHKIIEKLICFSNNLISYTQTDVF